jgi:hypothetical protein
MEGSLTMTTTPDNLAACPKCKALPIPGASYAWQCGSTSMYLGRPYQSQACRIRELEQENERLRLRLLSAAGDDLCRLSQEEIKTYTSGKVQIPPKEEFLPSCERFHAQIASEAGVLEGCLTLAQLIAENAKLEAENALLRSASLGGSPPPGPAWDELCGSCKGDDGHENGLHWIASPCTCHPALQENRRLHADLEAMEKGQIPAMEAELAKLRAEHARIVDGLTGLADEEERSANLLGDEHLAWIACALRSLLIEAKPAVP